MKVLTLVVGVGLMMVGFTVRGTAQGQELKGTLMDIACSSHHATEAKRWRST